MTCCASLGSLKLGALSLPDARRQSGSRTSTLVPAVAENRAVAKTLFLLGYN
jgi:hypothetical protein